MNSLLQMVDAKAKRSLQGVANTAIVALLALSGVLAAIASLVAAAALMMPLPLALLLGAALLFACAGAVHLAGKNGSGNKMARAEQHPTGLVGDLVTMAVAARLATHPLKTLAAGAAVGALYSVFGQPKKRQA